MSLCALFLEVLWYLTLVIDALGGVNGWWSLGRWVLRVRWHHFGRGGIILGEGVKGMDNAGGKWPWGSVHSVLGVYLRSIYVDLFIEE